MATGNDLAYWLKQNGFEKYAEKITKEAGITDKEGLKVDFDEVCNLLDLSDEEKDKFKKTVFATNVDEMQKLCEDCDTVQFKDALVEAGYTDIDMLLNKTERELDKIGREVGMQSEHFRKFKTAVVKQQFEVNITIATTCIFFEKKKIKRQIKSPNHFVVIFFFFFHLCYVAMVYKQWF
ncbi:hypothetical protein RFI_38168 [Reticulomyxa filosa]|uniref:SAM domain-containing protein n=1 Tax=Reticulomyxa filosa TaxID=46433 RepID=X6LCP3_RETFI|nr:hypothetical protein RFI_38168 [Reticulomyxa filosa]|eukprot:ETN99313.1 hypothetical protein RFI_38168 [Reticulomyxa filosa]